PHFKSRIVADQVGELRWTRSPTMSREEVVAHDVGNDRNDFLLCIDVFPRRHAAKTVVNSVPYEFWLIATRLKLRRFPRIGTRPVAMGTLVLPQLFARTDDLRVLEHLLR